MKVLLIFLTFNFLVLKCPNNYDNYDFTYNNKIGIEPLNLELINSEFDDFNSNLPYPTSGDEILFSTNRNGKDFNFIHCNFSISYHSKDDAFNLDYGTNSDNKSLNAILSASNSNFDELGPYSYSVSANDQYFFYSNNESGNHDIKYLKKKVNKDDPPNLPIQYYAPVSFKAINSAFDDYYPSIYENDSKLLFCSNRDNNDFNIYETPFSLAMLDSSYNGHNNINLVKELSSNKNDKCPYIRDDILLFTSDRDGGFGGFDLYYSIRKNGAWSTPVNLGNKINSEFDEYRPIYTGRFPWQNDLIIIFSSNRPGGLGGFDLYAVKATIKTD